jgi:MerR, DNA binding
MTGRSNAARLARIFINRSADGPAVPWAQRGMPLARAIIARVSDPRRYGADAVRCLEVLDVAKRAGFSLDEARVPLQTADAGRPAFEALRELTAHKLPDVDAVIERAQAIRQWLLTASDCSCPSLDVCALSEPGADERLQSDPTDCPAHHARA